MFVVFALITAQGLLGGLDNLWHHEITERLPAKRAAAGELVLHSARELLYSFVFVALAWFRWQGGWAVLIAGVLGIEVVITLVDFVVEDKTRRLPAFERVLHTILAVNFGAVLALLAPILVTWWGMPSAVVFVSYGPISWIFTVFGIGVFAWSVRNAVAVLKLRRPPEWARNPILVGLTAAPRTVLVSGATGFIGGHLVRRLIKPVRVCARYSSGPRTCERRRSDGSHAASVPTRVGGFAAPTVVVARTGFLSATSLGRDGTAARGWPACRTQTRCRGGLHVPLSAVESGVGKSIGRPKRRLEIVSSPLALTGCAGVPIAIAG